MSLPNIEVRSKALRGGRASFAPGTDSKRERLARKGTLEKLKEQGRFDIIERIRTRQLTLAQVHHVYKMGDLDSLRPVVGTDLTMQAVTKRFLAETKARKRAGTFKLKSVIARAMLAHFGPTTLVSDISSEDIRNFLFSPKVKGRRGPGGRVWSASRQEQARLMGSQLWQLAIESERELAEKAQARPRITIDPWKAIRIPEARAGHERVAFLTGEQWLALENANRDLPELALCALGTLAGLREGEAASLRTDVDVDLDAGLLRIQPRRGAHGWAPKTKRSVRVVPMSERLRAILKRHIELGFAGTYLLHSPKANGPLGKTGLRNWTMAAFKRAGITYGRDKDGFTNHGMRHSFASLLAQHDVQLLKIAMLMGDTIETVSKYYAHLLPQDLERTVQLLDEILHDGH